MNIMFLFIKSVINFFARCLTGSYDRTCKVWDIDSGAELLTLEGHKNVVYTVSFNNPISIHCWRNKFNYSILKKEKKFVLIVINYPFFLRDKIVTGSFDNTVKVWCSRTGHCFLTMWGHNAEVVVARFSPNCNRIGTGSLDMTSKIFDLTTGEELGTLRGHTAEIIALQFNNDGNQMITGSFDGTVSIWDARTF
ncbi:unnamed protein product, partial [Heterotrigona itama]